MLILLNRLCWNSRDWCIPTETSGDGGYKELYGFGHEEWNFQVDDAVDGFVYGYLYYVPNQDRIKESKGHFKIYFWTRHPQTRQKFIVGCYEDAQFATPEDMRKVDQVFNHEGIYARRVRELEGIAYTKPDAYMTTEQIDQNLKTAVISGDYKFKCPVDKIKFFGEQGRIPLKDFVPERGISLRFTNPTILELQDIGYTSGSNTQSSTRLPQRRAALTLIEDAYFRESPAHLKEITPYHNRLSNHFAGWLKKNNFENIRQEENFSDVLFEKRDKTYRAELKICYGGSASRSIREALGQLLEYNYYPNAIDTNYWLIILDRQPTPQDIDYISTLKEKLKLPLSLGWKQDKGFAFSSRLGIP